MLRRTAALALPLLLATALVPPAGATDRTESRTRATPQVQLTSWSSYAELKSGKRRGLKMGRGQVSLLEPKPRTVAGRAYEAGPWTSPWAATTFPATSLIPSWEATTPGRSLVRVQVRGRDASGRTGTCTAALEVFFQRTP